MKKITFVLLFTLSVVSYAADLPNSADHPMISRYDGAEIMKYEQRDFEEVDLIQGPINQRGGKAKNADAFVMVTGKMTRIAYRMPKDRSNTEIFANYKSALSGAGFSLLFECKNETCGGKPAGRPFNETVTPPDMSVRMGFHEKDQRYLLAELVKPQGKVYASLYMVRAYGIGGPDKERVFANLIVVESKQMDTGKVRVDADAMAKGLDAEGHIALYDIYFDSNKAELKVGSADALEQIQLLLQQRPTLQLLVVGHTDNQGALDYNQDLSRRRANAVVKALVENYGIHSSRLTPVGVGMAAPVAANTSDVGRSLNRRVELVQR